jgi:predicted MFS family arabinose efflux permease
MRTSEGLFSRNFLLLNGVLFLVSITLAVFFQFHQYLKALGIAPEWFGLIIGADSIPSFFILPFLSPFLNGRNARKWMFAGAFAMTAALVSYKYATTVPSLGALRLLHGSGFIVVFAALMAIIVNYIPQEKSGQAFGLISMNRLLPYALIPPLLGALGDIRESFPIILDCCATITGIVIVLVLLLRSSSGHTAVPDRKKGISFREVSENLRDRNVALLLFINLLLYSGYTIIFFYLKQYGASVGIKNAGFFFTIATAAMIGIRFIGGILFDRFSKVLFVTLCMIVLAACYAMLGHIFDSAVFYIIAAITGLAWGIGMPLLNALMFDVSPIHFRALNVNLSVVMMQGGFFAGPFAGGILLSQYGYGTLFYSCAALSLIGAVFTFAIAPKEMK